MTYQVSITNSTISLVERVEKPDILNYVFDIEHYPREYDRQQKAKAEYSQALSQAQAKAVQFRPEDRTVIIDILRGENIFLNYQEGQLFDIPSGWVGEIVNGCSNDACPDNLNCDNCSSEIKFARLVRVPDKGEKPNGEPAIPLPSDRDWKEDFSHENGNYVNKCIECGNRFMGHKRRVICRSCSEPDWVELSKRKPPEDTKDNKAWAGAWLEGEMVGYAKCMVQRVLDEKGNLKKWVGEVSEGEKKEEPSKTVEEIYSSFLGHISTIGNTTRQRILEAMEEYAKQFNPQ